jgi:hypothetical protein
LSPYSRSGIVVNDNDEYTTSSLSLPPKPDHCEASRVLVPEDRFHRRNSRYAVIDEKDTLFLDRPANHAAKLAASSDQEGIFLTETAQQRAAA